MNYFKSVAFLQNLIFIGFIAVVGYVINEVKVRKNKEIQAREIFQKEWDELSDRVPMIVAKVFQNGYLVQNDTLQFRVAECETCGKIRVGDTLYYSRTFVKVKGSKR